MHRYFPLHSCGTRRLRRRPIIGPANENNSNVGAATNALVLTRGPINNNLAIIIGRDAGLSRGSDGLFLSLSLSNSIPCPNYYVIVFLEASNR